MKGLILTTSTCDTIKLIQSFRCLGFPTEVFVYDVPDANIVAAAEAIRPDVIAYIGAVGEFHNGGHIPTTDQLCQVNRIAPSVHLCSDSADPPWWNLLEEYHRTGAFTLQVGIDGCYDTPLASYGMIALTPIDPSWFPKVAWNDKTHDCGFSGGYGVRWDVIGYLQQHGLIQLPASQHCYSYEEMCAFYSRCRLIINDSRTGSNQRRHVKGRFVEAALAGAVPIEAHDSPAKHWFTPGVDFLEWHTLEDAANHVRALSNGKREEYGFMAQRLHDAVLAKHAAQPFWKSVFGRMGL